MLGEVTPYLERRNAPLSTHWHQKMFSSLIYLFIVELGFESIYLYLLDLNPHQWRIQEFKNRGALYCFSSEDCFDAPSHIPYAFVVRVENKIHIVNIEC